MANGVIYGALILTLLGAPLAQAGQNEIIQPDVWGLDLKALEFPGCGRKCEIDVHSVSTRDGSIRLIILAGAKKKYSYYLVNFSDGRIIAPMDEDTALKAKVVGSNLLPNEPGGWIRAEWVCHYFAYNGYISFVRSLPNVKPDVWPFVYKDVAVISKLDRDEFEKYSKKFWNCPIGNFDDSRRFPNVFVAQTPTMADLGDGTILAWGAYVKDEMIRFRRDGTTDYRPRRVAIVDSDVLRETIETADDEAEFQQRMKRLFIQARGEE